MSSFLEVRAIAPSDFGDSPLRTERLPVIAGPVPRTRYYTAEDPKRESQMSTLHLHQRMLRWRDI